MSCINIYHPDYIKLLSEIDDSINPFELPTLIRLYQKMNNTDKIPSVSEIYEIDNRTKSQERLNQIQPDVILPIGTSGSGKSTFIKSLPQENLVIIEPDAMRVEFTGDMNDKSKDKEIYIEAANRAIKAIKGEPNLRYGYTRLYRAENEKGVDSPAPDWVKENQQVKESQEASGRWFYKTYEEAKYHSDKFGGEISYVDIPTNEVEKYNAKENKFAGGYGKQGNEYFVSKEIARDRKNLILKPKQVVFDTTNLTKDKRLPFIEAIKKAIPTANIQYKLMELNPELAKQRIKNRLKTNPPVEKFKGFWNRQQVASQTDKVFLFGDNTNDRTVTKYIPSVTQAVIRGLPNAIGIDTKKDRGTSANSYLTDSDFNWFKNHVDTQIQIAKNSGKTIVLPADGIGTGKAMLKEKAPKLFEYLQEQLKNLELTQGANVPDSTIDRHAESYKQMLEDIKNEPISEFKNIDLREQLISNIKTKEEVSELFESNLELANQIYEALGFKILPKKGTKEYRDVEDILELEMMLEELGNEKLRGNFKFQDILLKADKTKGFTDKYVGWRKYFNVVTDMDTMIGIYGYVNEKEGYTQSEDTLQQLLQLIKNHVNEFKIEDITPQQKQQATFMFSEFLDVYLQDFNQVEKILKEEKIIDKKCS